MRKDILVIGFLLLLTACQGKRNNNPSETIPTCSTPPVSCPTDTLPACKTDSAVGKQETDTLPASFEYDTLLYGANSKMIGFKRHMNDDSLKIVDSIFYKSVQLAEPDAYYSRDLQMNILRGPVRAIRTHYRPIKSNTMQKDSSWCLAYEPFNDKKNKKVDSTLFDKCGLFQKGNIVYENWNITPNKSNKVKRDAAGRVKEVTITDKEFGTMGSRFFYDSNGFIQYYTVIAYENSYKTTYHFKDGYLRTAEIEGLRVGEPYRYKRTFTPVDTDEYGNWTVRICKEFYFPGTLYLQEGQEKDPNATGGFSVENLEAWNFVIQWDKSWDKKEDVSQFSVFMETPSNARGWVEVREISYK